MIQPLLPCRTGVAAFIHLEPTDTEISNPAETKLVKNARWPARKWDVREIFLHSFTHPAAQKFDPARAESLLVRVGKRLEK